jgi:hypothetical protein
MRHFKSDLSLAPTTAQFPALSTTRRTSATCNSVLIFLEWIGFTIKRPKWTAFGRHPLTLTIVTVTSRIDKYVGLISVMNVRDAFETDKSKVRRFLVSFITPLAYVHDARILLSMLAL